MGKLIYYIIVLIVFLSLAGCRSTSQEPTSTPLPSQTHRSPTEPLPSSTQTPSSSQTPRSPTETRSSSTQTPLPPTTTLDPAVFEIRSSAFGNGEKIPRVYTCNGEDISPPLEWGDPPDGSQSLVLLVEDISAGNLVHWILFNIPPDLRSMPEGISNRGHFEDGRQQGMNHIFELGYFGPCPLPGPNQYRFRLYAIDIFLNLEDGVMKIPLKDAMKGHILAEAEFIGVYP